RGSIAALDPPHPTLRPHPRGSLRTARGRCGSLLLHRSGLSPPTPCRFHRRTTCQVLRPRRVFGALAVNVPLRIAFHKQNCVGTRDVASFAARWLAYALPCQRFADTLATICA